MTGKLSARLRPHAEAAPWVIEAVVRLEQEVERLRAEVERLRAHRESCAANLLKGYETGKADERAAVVAWMRDLGDQVPVARDQWIADCIERGEHRREENE